MADYRSDLARARGLGSAKHGVGSFIAERVTSIALIPLVVWAVYSALTLAAADYPGATAWLSSPINAVLVSLLIIVGFWHMHIGMRVIIEDYIGKALTRTLLLLLNLFICVLGGGLAVFSVLKVAITGGVV